MHLMNPYGATNPYHDRDSPGCVPYEENGLGFGQELLFRRVETE